MASAPVIAIITLGLILTLLFAPRYPSALIALAAAIALAGTLAAKRSASEICTVRPMPAASLALRGLPSLDGRGVARMFQGQVVHDLRGSSLRESTPSPLRRTAPQLQSHGRIGRAAI